MLLPYGISIFQKLLCFQTKDVSEVSRDTFKRLQYRINPCHSETERQTVESLLYIPPRELDTIATWKCSTYVYMYFKTVIRVNFVGKISVLEIVVQCILEVHVIYSLYIFT